MIYFKGSKDVVPDAFLDTHAQVIIGLTNTESSGEICRFSLLQMHCLFPISTKRTLEQRGLCYNLQHWFVFN